MNRSTLLVLNRTQKDGVPKYHCSGPQARDGLITFDNGGFCKELKFPKRQENKNLCFSPVKEKVLGMLAHQS